MKTLFSIMLNLQTRYHFKLDFQKSGPTCRRQVVDLRHQTQQAVTKPGTHLYNILVKNLIIWHKGVQR